MRRARRCPSPHTFIGRHPTGARRMDTTFHTYRAGHPRCSRLEPHAHGWKVTRERAHRTIRSHRRRRRRRERRTPHRGAKRRAHGPHRDVHRLAAGATRASDRRARSELRRDPSPRSAGRAQRAASRRSGPAAARASSDRACRVRRASPDPAARPRTKSAPSTRGPVDLGGSDRAVGAGALGGVRGPQRDRAGRREPLSVQSNELGGRMTSARASSASLSA